MIEALQYHMRNLGIILRLNEDVTHVSRPPEDGPVHIRLKSGKELHTGTVMYSISRVGATSSLNLEAPDSPVMNAGVSP
jgi:NAD(P) transhydrogenase